MENPATWGKAEHVVNDVWESWHGTNMPGLSLARQITDALRREGLLNEDVAEEPTK